MIKAIVTFVHFFQLTIHSWFMYQSVVYFYFGSVKESIWSQFKFLTNFSNWMMLAFLIPFAYYDIKNYYSRKIKDRYPTFVNLLFQGLNPVIFLVMSSYYAFLLIDPKLLVIDGFYPNEWQQVLLFYLHCGNWILMQVEFFLYEHEKIPKIKLFVFFATYTAVYLMIYGAYFYFEGKHVYGFQQSLGVEIIIIMNLFQFFTLYTINFLYNQVTHSRFFKKFVLECKFEQKSKSQ